MGESRIFTTRYGSTTLRPLSTVPGTGGPSPSPPSSSFSLPLGGDGLSAACTTFSRIVLRGGLGGGFGDALGEGTLSTLATGTE